MEDMEAKLGSILGNPQLMQQIMSMAQNLGANQESAPPPQTPSTPDIDPAMIQKLAGLAAQSGIDQDQQTLLHALGPYLAQDRLSRLERAMRAAKTAKLATTVLGQGGLSFLTGR